MTPYATPDLVSDVMTIISANAPAIIAVGVVLGTVNFIIVWFMHIMFRGLRP